MKQKLKFLKGFPKGFPKGAPFGLHLPIHGRTEPVDPGDETIRYIQSDFFGVDYMGTDYR